MMASASTWVHLAQATKSAVVLTLLDRTLVHRRYLSNNVGTDLQLSILRQIQMKLPKFQKRNMANVGIEPTTLES